MKTEWIILIVVVVGIYLLYKKGLFGGTTTPTPGDGEAKTSSLGAAPF